MELQLPRETETWLHDQARQAGVTVQEVVVATLQEKARAAAARPREDEHRSAMADLRAWSQSHAAGGHAVDDSRESIYEGRGL